MKGGQPKLIRDAMLEIVSKQNNSGWPQGREQALVMLRKNY
jgi:hypothetical protein